MDPNAPDDDRLYELLAAWDEQRQLGQEPSPEALCIAEDDPSLCGRLREEIAAQKRLEARLGIDESGIGEQAATVPTGPPEIPGIAIEAEVGRGAMGVVYRGRQIALGRLVAVKVVLGGSHSATRERARLRTEAVAMARIPHPNIVAIHDSGESLGLPYLVLEYLGGGSLYERTRGEPQDPRRAAELVRALASAVAQAHAQGVVHRDLKPRNVLFTVDGTPKISDYGLAKLMDGNVGQTLSGQSPGTPSYMAPEQAGVTRYEVGLPTDLYALGAILYELLTGRPPLQGPTVVDTLELIRNQDPVPPRRLQPKTPRDLETICLKCLQKNPAHRFASANALIEDLDRFLAGRPIVSRRTSAIEQGWRWCKRRPDLAAALAALALVAIAGFVGVTWQWRAAVANQHTAEKNLSSAFDAIEDFYKAFDREASRNPTDLGPYRERFYRPGLAHVRRLATEFRGNPRARRELSIALGRLSQIENGLGQLDSARNTSREALTEADLWLRESPDDAERRDTLASALHAAIFSERDSNQLLTLLRRADEVYKTPPYHSKGVIFRQQRIINRHTVGVRLIAAGMRDRGIALLREACDLGEQAIRSKAQDDLILNALGRTYSDLAYTDVEAGRFNEAEAAFRRSNAMFLERYERQPTVLLILLDYCQSSEQLETFLQGREAIEEAIRISTHVCDVLTRASPQPHWRPGERLTIDLRLLRANHNAAINLSKLVSVLQDKKDGDGAAKAMADWETRCLKTHELAESLRPFAPSDDDLLYYHCMSCTNLYLILDERNEEAEKLDEWLKRARSLLPSDLNKVSNEVHRRDYQSVRDILDEAQRKRDAKSH